MPSVPLCEGLLGDRRILSLPMKLAPSRLLAIGAVMGGLLPLVVGAPAPMPDWPSHLARVWITDRVLAGDPFWTARYFFQGFFIPNAALDVGVLGLMWLGLSMNTAGSVFLVFVYAVFISGFVALSRRSGAMTALTWPLACASFYALPFIWGFVNFWLGIGSMLWVLSFWERAANTAGAEGFAGDCRGGRDWLLSCDCRRPLCWGGRVSGSHGSRAWPTAHCG